VGRAFVLGILTVVALGLSATSALAAGGQITGRVSDPAGQPVAGLTVEATSSANATYSASTDADGRYAIAGLPADGYQVAFLSVASGLSFANFYYRDPQTASLGGVVFVSAGGTTPGVDAQLGPPGHISGTVTDQQGHGLAGFVVSVRAPDTPEYAFPVTDAAGHYTTGPLAAGSYTVGVESDSLSGPAGRGYVPENYHQKLGSQTPDPVTVEMGATTAGIDVQLHAAGQISGVVTDPVGSPLVGATVAAIDGGGHAAGSGGTTGVDGAYQISNLEPGSYTVRFGPPWASDYLGTDFAGPVVVAASATTAGINAKLAHLGVITGTVTDSAGHPLAGIIASLAPPGFAPVGGVPQHGSATDAQGRYTINLVAPGVYSVYFSGGSYVAQYYGGASSLDAAATIVVSGGTTATGIDARMQQGGAITGTVTDRLGAPLSALVQAVVPHGPLAGRTITEASGRYTLGNLAPGSYIVSFQALQLVPLGQYYNGRTSPDAADLVTVVAGATTTGVDARLTAALPLPPLPPSSVGVLPGTFAVSLGGALRIGLRCTGPASCLGTASLSAASPASAAGRRRARRVTIGTTRFRLAAGRHGSFRLRLNAAGRVLLRGHGGRLRATLTVVSASGTHTTAARLRSRQ
jgi:hypothetical protein